MRGIPEKLGILISNLKLNISYFYLQNSKTCKLPFFSSNCLINGILTQFAAATAQKGTNRPINGGACFTRAFSPRAVTKAPVVAATYDVAVIIHAKLT